jgi:hypothetical protein
LRGRVDAHKGGGVETLPVFVALGQTAQTIKHTAPFTPPRLFEPTLPLKGRVKGRQI